MIKITKFILGVVVGLVLFFGFYFMFSSNTKLHIDAGRLLDQDAVYLEDGSIVKGWIVNEGGYDILIETGGATFTLPLSKCVRIEKDVFLKFVRKVI
ncbi:hypothetical protein ACFL1K_05415 [Candidatus Omnitrophota bacterium]